MLDLGKRARVEIEKERKREGEKKKDPNRIEAEQAENLRARALRAERPNSILSRVGRSRPYPFVVSGSVRIYT